VFVSATIDAEIQRLASEFTTDPVMVNVSRDEMTVEEVNQVYVTVQPWDKFELLMRLMRVEDPRLAIIFTNTKHAARKLAKRLHHAGVDAKEIHGDLLQQRRERVMEKFRKHKLRVLVATDLASRGIDVQGISHIINYDFPRDPEIYVHRIGRTARMGAFGAAYSFVSREEGKELTQVEKLINKEIREATIEGFVPREPPDDARSHRREAAPPPVSRLAAPVAAQTGEAPARPVPRTLGGKFRPSRRRRR
jgi:ATP-dependent RNA helicase DeaD